MPQEAVVNAALLGSLRHLQAGSAALTLEPKQLLSKKSDWVRGHGRAAKWGVEIWLNIVPASNSDPCQCEGLPHDKPALTR